MRLFVPALVLFWHARLSPNFGQFFVLFFVCFYKGVCVFHLMLSIFEPLFEP